MTTLAEDVRAIHARRRVPLAIAIVERDGSVVRSRFRDGTLDEGLTRRAALEGGKAILQVMRRKRHPLDMRRRRRLTSFGRALIAVAKSIPE